eukprot:14747257-Ditylum_brightwellii.AAC.1
MGESKESTLTVMMPAHQLCQLPPFFSAAALLLSCVIDAKEKKDDATLDVPNAFMQADMDDL